MDEVQDNRGGFYQIYNSLIEDDRVDCYMLGVYNVLALHASKVKHDCYPSHARMADKLRISKPTVIKALKALTECGYISVFSRFEGPQQKSNLYVLNPVLESPKLSISTTPSKGALPPQSTSFTPPVKEVDTNNTQLTIPNEQEVYIPAEGKFGLPPFPPKKDPEFDVYIAWTCCGELIRHKSFLPDMRTRVRQALKDYSVDEISNAIRNYATVISDSGKGRKYYFTYRLWTLPDFLNKGLCKFVDEAKPLTEYLNDKYSQARPKEKEKLTMEDMK